jgi:16S rRNA (guanine527-N7)-methyltransferase
MKEQEALWLAEQLALWGIRLPETSLQQLPAFLDELLRWNRRINLTAITERREALEKHLLDSLSLLPLLRDDERVLDLGSGAGLPGLPLKLAKPRLQLCSVDAVQKKIAFQRHIARLFQLQDFQAIHARVETLVQDGAFVAGFDVVIARAVASLPTLLGWGLPLLRPRGRLIAMKGPEGAAEVLAAQGELKAWQVECIEQRRLRLPASGAERILLTLARS